MNYHENARFFYGINKLIVNLRLIVSDCSGNQAIYRRTHSCTGEEETDLRLEDGKCGYSTAVCILNMQSSANLTTDYKQKNSSQTEGRPSVVYDSRYGEEDCAITTCYSECTATSNQSWATPSVTIFLGLQVVNVNVTENTSTSSRNATITVRNECGETDMFTVTQEGKPNYVFNFGSGSTTSSFNPPRAGSKNDFNITSSKNGVFQEFTTSNPISSWAPHTFGSTSGTSRSMSVTASANPDFETRSGTITFTQNESGKTITMNVSQPGFNRHCQVNIEETRRASSSTLFIADFTFDMSQGDTPNACWSSCVDYDIMFTVTGGTITNAYSSKTDSMGSTSTTITPGSSNEVAHCTGSYCGGKVYVTLYIDIHSGYDMNRVHIALDRTDTGNGNCLCDLNHSVG